MIIVVADIEPVLELHRVDLAAEIFRLPHEFSAVDLCVSQSCPAHETDRLSQLGLRITELDGREVGEAAVIVREHRDLSVRDAMSIVLAERHKASLLSTIPGLSRIARAKARGVMGAAWIFDALQQTVPIARLLPALEALAANGRCGLSEADLRKRISVLRP